MFENNIFFGTGYKAFWLVSYADDGKDYGLADIPLLANFAIYGIVGMFLYFLMYIQVFKRIKSFYKLIKTKLTRELIENNSYQLIFIIYFVASFFNTFFRFFYLSADLSYRTSRISLGFSLGAMFGLMTLIEERLNKNKPGARSSMMIE